MAANVFHNNQHPINPPPTPYFQQNQPSQIGIPSGPSSAPYENSQSAAMPPAPPLDSNTNTSYHPYRVDAQNHAPSTTPQSIGLAQEYYDQAAPSTLHLTAETSTLDLSDSTQDTDRGLFSSSPGDKSKKKELMDKGVKFVVKRIEKKMNKQSHGQGAGQEVQAVVEEHIYGGEGQQGYGAEASVQASGGDYGYGAGTEEYGYPQGLYDHVQGSGLGEVDAGGLAEAGGEFDWGELLAF